MGYATERFAKRLKEIREAAGLTQAQLASELKVSRGAISYYEKGERTPDIEFLDALSMYFNLPLDFILGYTDNVKSEYKDMYEIYGLTDKACEELDFDNNIGHLISAILGHDSFYALKCIYEGVIKNYKTFDLSQLGYVGFLISDSLNKIVFDSLKILWDIQLTPAEKDALRIRHEIDHVEFEKMREIWDQEENQRREEREKRNEEDKVEWESSLHHSVLTKIHEKFYDTIDHVEFRREHP